MQVLEIGSLGCPPRPPDPLLVTSRTHYRRRMGAEVHGTVEQERKAPSLALGDCRDVPESLIFGRFIRTKES